MSYSEGNLFISIRSAIGDIMLRVLLLITVSLAVIVAAITFKTDETVSPTSERITTD